MQIMADKGLVKRDEEQRAHVYHARIPQEQTQRQMVSDLVRRVFNDSGSQLVMHVLSGSKTSPEELAQIRQLLDELERGEK